MSAPRQAASKDFGGGQSRSPRARYWSYARRMSARLLACPSCSRHIRLTEERCPFCGVACPDSFASSPSPVPPPRGLSRAGLSRYSALRIIGSGMLASAFASGQAASAGCGHVATEETDAGETEETGMPMVPRPLYGGPHAFCDPTCEGGTDDGNDGEASDASDAPSDAGDGD